MATVEELRRHAEQIKRNFLSGDVTYYDDNFMAWYDDDGTFFVGYRGKLHSTRLLFKAVQLVMQIQRGI